MPVVLVAASLLVMAAAMTLVGVNAAESASHLRSSPMPGFRDLAVQWFDALEATSWVTAVALVVLAVATLVWPGWFASMLSAFVSIPAAGTGIWVVVGDGFRLANVQVGPVSVSVVLAGIVLVCAAAVCLASSVAMWRLLPRGPLMVRPHMPPPTHQG